MSKSDGLKIVIKFTDDLSGDQIGGNKQAFSVTGLERKYVNGLYDNAPLVERSYNILSLERQPDTENSLLITFNKENRFNNVHEKLKVNYNSDLGTLVGKGGLVNSFSKEFTPEELIRTPNPGHAEKLSAKVGEIGLDLKLVSYYDIEDNEGENIGAGVGIVSISMKPASEVNP